METIEQMIARISAMENCFDRLLANPAEIHTDAELAEQLTALQEYYASAQWMQDYEADEQGLLPADLKRGVLSQDAVYNFLEEWA